MITTDISNICYQIRIFPNNPTTEVFGGRSMTLNGKMQLNYIGNDLLLMTSTKGNSMLIVQYIVFTNLDGTTSANGEIEEGKY